LLFYDYSGDTQRALEWLERAFVERDQEMICLNVSPLTDRVRATPAFWTLCAE